MFDPRARRRPTTTEKSVRTFYRMALWGAALVGLAVLVSMFTGSASSLIHQEWNQADGNLLAKALSVAVNSTLYLLAFLLPMVLLAGGVAMPVIALVRFRDFALHPRHGREHARGASAPIGKFPLRTAWLLVFAEVPLLLVLAAVTMNYLGPADTRNPGIGNREIYLEPPGEEMPYWRNN